MRLSITPAIAMAVISTVALAQTERDLDSHVHGSAKLNVAIDDTAVFLELDSPWDNLVGFEHSPETDEQHALVDGAIDLLNQPDQLFLLEGGSCTFNDMSMEGAMQEGQHAEPHHDEHDVEEHDGDKHDGDEHDGDEHDGDEHDGDEHDGDEHDGDEHDGDEHDGDEHDGDEHDEDGHASALVSYHYTCNDTASLTAIGIRLFTLWPGFEDLDVQLIGPGGQAQVELNQQQTVLDITQVQ